jgi:hypothetical protein
MWLVAGAAEAIPPAERQGCVAVALTRWMWNTREISRRQMRDTAIIPGALSKDRSSSPILQKKWSDLYVRFVVHGLELSLCVYKITEIRNSTVPVAAAAAAD